uniref:Bridge-like lipid transfer protein family member 1 n=1 Tax=Terrapene triunguis TaxID=2587831 RepID=A0A674ILM4_9SAUR
MFSSDVSRSDENVLDSPKQRRSFGSFPYTPSADSNSFHQYRSMDSSMSMADSEAYFSAAEEFEPISSDEGPGTYPGRKKRKKQAQQIEYSRGSIYHSVEGPLTSTVHGEASQDPKTLPIKTHASQASFVSAVGEEDELVEHMYIMEAEKAVESDQITSQQPIMTCYQSYLTQFQVVNWSVKHPTNKRTSKSSLHRPLDLDTPTSEESSSSFEHFSVPTFKFLFDLFSTPYTPLEKKTMDNTDDETITEEWTLDHPVSQTRTTAIVEVKGTVDVVLTPLVAEALDRYIEAMVHCASTQHPAAIVDDLHYKVLREAVQNSKTTFSENLSSKQDVRGTKTENPATGTTNQGQAQTNLSLKQDNVKIKGLQANVTIPKVNLCLLQASVEETSGIASGKTVTHVSLVALCFDRIATQVRMNRGVIEETSNNADTGRNSVTFDRYIHASKMQPQSSGSLRSNAGAEKGKEIAAKLNIHRVHGQLRGLDATDIGTCAITAIPFEKSKVLFTLEELDEFTFVDETDQQAVPDVTRIGPSQERWGWIMFECGIENLTIKGGRQSGAVLYSTFGVMGKSNATERGGLLASNNSSDSPTGSGYNTDVSDDNLPCDRSPSSDINGNSVSDEQDEGVESDDLKKDLPLMPPPPDSCSMKLTIKEIWFSFAAPTNVRSPAHKFSRQLNLLSTATPAVGAWLVPIDQLKSSLNRLETEGTLRICAVMGCIMTEALENKSMHFPLRSKYNRLTKVARFLQENPSCLLCNILHHYLHQANYSIIEDATMSDGLPALVTLKKGLVALARQWMKFIVVTPAFKGVSLHRPAQPLKPQTTAHHEHEDGVGLDNGGGLQSDTSADGAEFEFDAATVSEHTMLLEGTANRPPPAGVSSGPVTGAEIMRKLSKTHTHSDSALKIKVKPYHIFCK